MTAHDRYLELVYGYALSSLEPEDEQALVAHLPACAECSRALVEARETAGHLAYAVDTAELPPGLFASIREGVLAESPDAFDLTPAAPQERRPTAHVVPIQSARRRRLETRAAKLVAVAASVSVAAVVGLGAWNLSLQRDNAQKGELSASVIAALDVIKAGNGQTVQMRDSDGDIKAVAVMHAATGTMDLVTDGLAVNDARKTQYVMWAQTGTAAPTYLAAFNIDDDHVDTVTAIVTSKLAAQPDALLISKEPGRVGEVIPGTPTTPIYAEGRTL